MWRCLRLEWGREEGGEEEGGWIFERGDGFLSRKGGVRGGKVEKKGSRREKACIFEGRSGGREGAREDEVALRRE